jgi:hypothetical protein
MGAALNGRVGPTAAAAPRDRVRMHDAADGRTRVDRQPPIRPRLGEQSPADRVLCRPSPGGVSPTRLDRDQQRTVHVTASAVLGSIDRPGRTGRRGDRLVRKAGQAPEDAAGADQLSSAPAFGVPASRGQLGSDAPARQRSGLDDVRPHGPGAKRIRSDGSGDSARAPRFGQVRDLSDRAARCPDVSGRLAGCGLLASRRHRRLHGARGSVSATDGRGDVLRDALAARTVRRGDRALSDGDTGRGLGHRRTDPTGDRLRSATAAGHGIPVRPRLPGLGRRTRRTMASDSGRAEIRRRGSTAGCTHAWSTAWLRHCSKRSTCTAIVRRTTDGCSRGCTIRRSNSPGKKPPPNTPPCTTTPQNRRTAFKPFRPRFAGACGCRAEVCPSNFLFAAKVGGSRKRHRFAAKPKFERQT